MVFANHQDNTKYFVRSGDTILNSRSIGIVSPDYIWSSSMPVRTGHSVQFLAEGSGDSPGILEPGESGRVPIYYLGMLRPWNFSDHQVELQVRIINGDEPASFNWDQRKAGMKPDSMDQAAWDIIFANLANGVGETWGDYITTLSENASYLYTHAGKKVDSTNQLMHFEMLQAVGHSPISVLGSEHDITVWAPGMDINFSRQYRNSISSRYTSGPLGKGWTHNYQLSIEEEADGNVILHAMNSRLRYTLDSRGGYFPPAGNYTKLSKNSDVFTITTSEGTKLVFNIDGTLNYIEDL